MNSKILKIFTVLLLIVTLTMANFVLLGVNVVSYAAEAVNIEKSTNNRNVEFSAYLKNDQGEKVTDLEVLSNAENLKAYFEISVKQEGYFNGKISLNNANFKFKSEISND